jgi:hypothetical protein
MFGIGRSKFREMFVTVDKLYLRQIFCHPKELISME